jgi:hypothetical protein
VSKGVSQYISAMNILNFDQFNPFSYSPLAFFSYPLVFNSIEHSSLYHLLDCFILFHSFLPHIS